MDLLTQLKTLRGTTKSPEVRSICESNIQKIEKGDSNVSSNAILESIQVAENQTVQQTQKDPHEMLREQEMQKSKSIANRLMESWGGLGERKTSKNSGAYVDGIKDESPSFDVSAINESLSNLVDSDPSAASFVKSQGVNNLGVFEAILTIKGSSIYEHPSVKVVCEKYAHNLKNMNVPEFLLAENFIADMQNFSWDSKVKTLIESIKEKTQSLKPEIEVSKALYTIQSNAGSDFYSPVTESLNKWLVSENKSVSLLSKELTRWQFNPAVRNLINTLGVLESNSEKLNIPIHSGNSAIKRLFSPVLVSGGKTIFTIGNNVFEGNSNGLRKLNRNEVSLLPSDFLQLLESFYTPYVKVNEQGLNVFIGKNKYSIIEENDSKSIYNNGTKMNFSDLNKLSKALALEISGSFGVNENKAIFDIINLFENFDKVVELDFAKRIESTLYEGASVNLIKWQGSIFLNRINESMKDNSLFQVNGTQASVMVKEFLKYDISEGLTEFLEGESRVRSIMLNDRSKLMENISIVETEISKLESKMNSNPIFYNSTEVKRAHFMLEQELKSLRDKWKVVNEELEKIDGLAQEINVNEDDNFNVGEYIKVKESGNTGKIISIDGTSGSYTVLMDNGKTGDFRVDEIVNLDDALATAGDENQADAETQEELKEGQSLAVAPGKDKEAKADKSILATQKKGTVTAPSGKNEDKAGKKDVENLKDANLEEAPEGESLTKYKANKEAGYNITEGSDPGLASAPEGKPAGTNMATEWEKSGIKNMNLATAPGNEEGDAGYEVKAIEVKEKNPELMNIDPELASAPGDEDAKELDYEVNKEMGYNVDESADIMKINQELAKAPGKEEGDADYQVKVVAGKAHNPEVMNTDPNFAIAPEKGAEADTDVEVNPEMGYNLDEANKAKGMDFDDLGSLMNVIAFIKKNKNSKSKAVQKDVQVFLNAVKNAMNESGASEANEDIETSIDESEESKKN